MAPPVDRSRLAAHRSVMLYFICGVVVGALVVGYLWWYSDESGRIIRGEK